VSLIYNAEVSVCEVQHMWWRSSPTSHRILLIHIFRVKWCWMVSGHLDPSHKQRVLNNHGTPQCRALLHTFLQFTN